MSKRQRRLTPGLSVAQARIEHAQDRVEAADGARQSLLDVEEELKGRGPVLRGLDRVYGAVLGWSLRHRVLVILAVLVIFVASLAMIPRVGVELIAGSPFAAGHASTQPWLSSSCLMVGRDARMRVSSMTAPSLTGTLKSTRTSTLLFLTSRSASLLSPVIFI